MTIEQGVTRLESVAGETVITEGVVRRIGTRVDDFVARVHRATHGVVARIAARLTIE